LRSAAGSCGDSGDLDYAQVCAAARAGAAIERRVVTNAARMLGVALVGVTNVLVPDVVVLGGAAVDAARFCYEPQIRAALDRSTGYVRGQKVRVEFSSAGAEVGAVGAASLVMHAAFAPRIPSA
ncbi:MAG: ROK family protein, partial [Actinopolymorphaceae bacterium]